MSKDKKDKKDKSFDLKIALDDLDKTIDKIERILDNLERTEEKGIETPQTKEGFENSLKRLKESREKLLDLLSKSK